MRNQALVYSSSVQVRDEPVVLKPKYYLVKPIYVFIDGLENYIVSGYAPTLKPIVLGHTGVARVIEAGPGSPGESLGSLVVVSPISLSLRSLLGYSVNGLLAKYASIPFDTVFSTLSRPRVEYSLLYHASIGILVGEIVGANNLLVVGLGVAGISTLYSASKASDVAVVTSSRKSLGLAKRLGYNTYKSLKEVKNCYSIIFIDTLSYPAIDKALEHVCSNGMIIVNPLIAHVIGRINVKLCDTKKTSIVIAYPNKDLVGKACSIIDKLVSYIRVVKPSSLEELKTIFPVKPPGIIVDLTELK